jgi:hypothetical protein
MNFGARGVQHKLFQLSKTSGDTRFNSAEGHAKNLSDFIVGIILKIKEGDGGAELRFNLGEQIHYSASVELLHEFGVHAWQFRIN